MRERRVAALAAPLPAAQRPTGASRGAVDLQCHGRHEGAGLARARFAARAGKGLLEELADLAIRIREVAGGRVAVVRGDDQPPSGGETLDEAPEVVAAQLLGNVLCQRFQPLALACDVVQLGVGPVVPEDLVRALPIRASQSFHGNSTVSVLAACSLCARPPPLFWSLLRLLKPSARANSSVSPGSSEAQAATSCVVKPRFRALQQPR